MTGRPAGAVYSNPPPRFGRRFLLLPRLFFRFRNQPHRQRDVQVDARHVHGLLPEHAQQFFLGVVRNDLRKPFRAEP